LKLTNNDEEDEENEKEGVERDEKAEGKKCILQ
jgi:hypothetical protein